MNNFKKLFFVLSFSFVFSLVAMPMMTSAQVGSCVDTGHCSKQGTMTCIGQCSMQSNPGFSDVCVAEIACSSITTAGQCLAPACSWNPLPSGTGSNVLPGGTGSNVLPGGSGQNQTNSSNLSLSNPLGADSVNELIGRVINSVMGIVGSLALLMFVYGGLTWMTSSGSQDKVKKGKDILLWSAVGLVVIFGAYALTKFIINLAT